MALGQSAAKIQIAVKPKVGIKKNSSMPIEKNDVYLTSITGTSEEVIVNMVMLFVELCGMLMCNPYLHFLM